MNTYIETDCTITAPNGNEFTNNGAYITPERAVVYCANEAISLASVYPHGRMSSYSWRGTLTDWHGNKVGTYVVKSVDNKGYSDTYYIDATIDGITYYGRTQGPGMVAFLKAHKHQA